MDIIDSHHQLWDLLKQDQDWMASEELAPLRRSFLFVDYESRARAAGVTATVLVQTPDAREQTPDLLALAMKHELIAGVVGWLDLAAEDVSDGIARLRELPGGDALVGIRPVAHGELDPQWLTRSNVQAGLAAVAEAGLAYSLVVTPDRLAACVQVARATPQLTFVLNHLGQAPSLSDELEPWSHSVRALAVLPNTVCKLSGMIIEAHRRRWTVADLRPYVDVVLDAFGPDRLIFGSDWPMCSVATRYDKVIEAIHALTAELSETERAAIFNATASRVYGLRLVDTKGVAGSNPVSPTAKQQVRGSTSERRLSP